MKAISQFVVHVFDLIEAEGSALRAVVRGEARRVQTIAANMAMGVAFLFVSVPLMLAGIGLLATGLMWWLDTQVNRSLAACLTGLCILGVGGGGLACFKLILRRDRP